ncbi:hypothetical protein A2616_02485 [Candidatus Woesebacteria bacterium RIFOXYD1_FULL_33_11]|nr:MAG: hypothetical protein A2616_02485 [Candidatus Woesebacteria bacterium RIFOXYD1_FULL_33_11]
MPKRNLNLFGLVGVLFLIITLTIAVWATDNPLKKYLLKSKACESAQECADSRVRQAERKAAYEGGEEWQTEDGTPCRGSDCLLIQQGTKKVKLELMQKIQPVRKLTEYMIPQQEVAQQNH